MITQTMIMGMVFFMYNESSKRRGSHMVKYGPFYMVLMAFPLIMADLVRHILQDTNVWPEPGSAEYRDQCPDETMKCLSTVGIIFTVVCTYLGFILLAVGVFWNAKILTKLKDICVRWKAIRRGEVE